MHDQHAFRASVTARELEVIELIANGYSVKDVGTALSIGPRTVQGYVESARLKLNAHTKTHLIVLALGAGLLEVTMGNGDDDDVPKARRRDPKEPYLPF